MFIAEECLLQKTANYIHNIKFSANIYFSLLSVFEINEFVF